MAADSSFHTQSRGDNFAGAFLLFMLITFVSIFLAWMFSPLALIFGETFDNEERNQQYSPCPAFTIVDERLRVTVVEPHSGCALQLPNEYDDFTLTASVFPVQDVYDGSVNVLYRKGSRGWYEIQFRPKAQEFNFIEWGFNAQGEPYGVFTTGWKPTPGTVLNDSKNTIRLTVTRYWMDFWFNETPVFKYTSPTRLPLDRGAINIGAGAGEAGEIAFEFDNLEIRKEKFFSRWWYDFMAIREFQNPTK